MFLIISPTKYSIEAMLFASVWRIKTELKILLIKVLLFRPEPRQEKHGLHWFYGWRNNGHLIRCLNCLNFKYFIHYHSLFWFPRYKKPHLCLRHIVYVSYIVCNIGVYQLIHINYWEMLILILKNVSPKWIKPF